MYRLEVLGRPRLVASDAAVSIPEKGLALLALLALGSPRSRQELSTLLWPSSGARSARHSLSQLLYRLDQACPQLVLRSNDWLDLTPLEVDWAELISAVAGDDVLAVERLYRGSFMEGFSLRGLKGLTDWVELKRNEAALTAKSLLETPADPAILMRLAKRLVEDLPFDPVPRQVYLEALRQLGDDFGADRFLNQTQALWAEELEEVFLENQPRVGTAAAQQLPFVGRRRELEQVLTVLQSRNANRAVIVEGDPGVGKSAFLRRTVRTFVIRGGKALFARSFPAERHLPLGIVGQWLRALKEREALPQQEPWSTIIKYHFPFLGDAECSSEFFHGSEGPQQLIAALHYVFAKTELQPLLLAVDDLQWADAASLGFISSLLRGSDAPPRFLATSCPDRELFRTIESWEYQRFVLEPLKESHVALLLDHLSDQGQTMSPAEAFRLSGGNPLVLSLVLQRGQELSDQSLSSSVRAYFEPILSGMSQGAVELVAALGLARKPRPIADCLPLLGLPPEAATATVQQGIDRGLLRLDPDAQLSLTYGAVGEVAMDFLAPADRAAVHGKVARWLHARTYDRDAVVALQFDIAGSRDEAFSAARNAAEASQKLFAYREAEFFWKLAISNAPGQSEEVFARTELADLLLSLGRTAQASALLKVDSADYQLSDAAKLRAYRALVSLSEQGTAAAVQRAWQVTMSHHSVLEPVLRARLFCRISFAAHDLGLADLTKAAIGAAESTLRNVEPERERIRWAVRSAVPKALLVDLAAGLETINGYISDATKWPGLLAVCLVARGSLQVAAGRPVEAEQDFFDALKKIERFGLVDHLFQVHNNLAVCYLEQYRIEEARGQLSHALEASSHPIERAVGVDNMATLEYECGDWRRAMDICEDGLAEDANCGGARSRYTRLSIRGLAALEVGALATARECERELEILLRNRDSWSNDISYVEIFLARMACIRGEDRVAAARLCEAVQMYQNRDVYCRSRMQLEYMRIAQEWVPFSPGTCREFRGELIAARAKKLVDELDGLMVRQAGSTTSPVSSTPR